MPIPVSPKDLLISELRSYLRSALDYIDSIPEEVVATLPAMPGFCRDDAELLFDEDAGVMLLEKIEESET